MTTKLKAKPGKKYLQVWEELAIYAPTIAPKQEDAIQEINNLD